MGKSQVSVAKTRVRWVGCLIFGLLIVSGFYFLDGSASEPLPPNTIVLYAADHDGRDPVWEKRHYYGLKSWGIRGSKASESGSMWFESFPGESGVYRVSMTTIFEQDGSPHYSVKAGDRVLKSGRYPYPKGKKNCEERGSPGVLELGEHRIEKGEKITVWGKSVYECGVKGAYTLWDQLRFLSLDKKK